MVFINTGFYLNLEGAILIIAVICISLAIFLDSLMQLKENGINICLKTLQSNKVKFIPMMVGFISHSIGIYFLSITHQVINLDGSPTGRVWHPLGTQGFVIFLVGTGIQLLEMIWYHDSVTSKSIQAKPASLG
jgi:hypothetical protein